MLVLIEIALLLLSICWWVALAMVILSWLIAFNVVNTRNQFVANVWQVLTALTEPLLRPIRRFVPTVGGFDLSVLVLFILINVAEIIIRRGIAPAVL